MANSKQLGGGAGRGRGKTPAGVWNRGTGGGPANPIRIRTKRLDEIQSDKIALAYWLLAKQLVEHGSDQPVTEAEARRVAAEFEAQAGAAIDGQAKRRRHPKGSA
jgi:hypothetical protein